MPEYLWLATGSLNEFKASKLEVHRNRRAVAFPDLDAYKRWLDKTSVIDFSIEVSNRICKHWGIKNKAFKKIDALPYEYC